MNVPALDTAAFPDAGPLAFSRPGSADGGFDAHLRARGGPGSADPRRLAEQLIAMTFIEPVLAMAREGSAGHGPFAPGTAERRFSPLLDQEIAARIVRRASFPLVDEIAKRLGEVTDALA